MLLHHSLMQRRVALVVGNVNGGPVLEGGTTGSKGTLRGEHRIQVTSHLLLTRASSSWAVGPYLQQQCRDFVVAVGTGVNEGRVSTYILLIGFCIGI